jgi:lipopolysaccharide export system protein LptC
VYSADILSSGTGLEARFAAAASHSRVVRLLRVGIPALVAASLGVVVLISLFNPFRQTESASVDMDNLVVSGTKITMEAPRLAGFSADNRPYEVWANAAIQDTAAPDNLALTEPRAKMLLQDLSTLNVESRTGQFAQKAQLLDLYKEVYLQTSNGYEARLNHAQVDIGSGAVSTDDGVNVVFSGGKVKADRLRLTERGAVVRFEGRVVMDLDRAPGDAAPRPTAAVESPRVSKRQPAQGRP